MAKRAVSKPEYRFCEKNDRDMERWNKAFPGKPKKFMECGYPLPCPWHTVVIDTAGPRVTIPETAGLSQGQRVKVRRLAVQISDALEKEEDRHDS